MQQLYRAINISKGLVLGTPIYFDHVSAQTKLFLDRLYAYLGPNLEAYDEASRSEVFEQAYQLGVRLAKETSFMAR
jgi:multimeric flavodoxin WrbA